MSGSARWNLGRLAEVRRSLVVTAVTVAIAGLVPVLGQVTASAAGTGSGVNYTLEGCRASSSAFPATGPFICLDSQYTTGNLGGGWNELDVVPGRVIVSAGNSAPLTQDVSFDVAVDTCSTTGSPPCPGTPGYDRLSVLTLNTNPGESSASCPTAASGAATVNGTSLFRQIDITALAQNSTCVYDFYARLAIGSHTYPGSSLHYNLTNTSHGTQGIGSKDISIPVRQIAPFVFSKTETASRDATINWTVDKSANSSISFTDTCADRTGQTVTVTVNWHKNQTNGQITVDGLITIGNNAHRPLGILVSDQLYDGAPPATPGAADGSPVVNDFSQSPYIAANHTQQLNDPFTPADQSESTYNDVASATINDPAFPGDTFNLTPATASATVATNPAGSGTSAIVRDDESLTDSSDPTSTTAASDYKFRVTAVAGATGTLYTTYNGPGDPGNVVYTPGVNATLINGPLTWISSSQSDSGTVQFTKVVVPSRATTETATLHDLATVTGSGGQAPVSSGTPAGTPTATNITSNATVSISINKSTNLPITHDNTFVFNAYAPPHAPAPGGDGVIAGTTSIKILANTQGPVTGTITGLEPGVNYLIDEPAVAPFPPSQFNKTVTLPSCSGSQNLTNTAAPIQAKVQKITHPSGATLWTFTLTGPNSLSETLNNVTANAGYVFFNSQLTVDGGTYTITETPQTNWDNTLIVGDIGSTGGSVAASTSTSSHTCSITLNITTEADSTFECTFTNVERSDVKVVKTENGAPPTHQITFELCPGNIGLTCGSNPPTGSLSKTTNQDEGLNPIGTLDFGYQVPGDYTLCEMAVPSGTHSSLQDSPYHGTLDGATGNVCAHIVLAPGSDQTISINNTTPRGNALTIGYWKHWNSVNVGSSSKAGNKLMDTFLPICLGAASCPTGPPAGYNVTTALQGVNVLSNPSMKYAENGLAAQLLAAKLNVASGALTCTAITNAITQADSLLHSINYTGPPSSVVGNKYANRQLWVTTQSTLDAYNNNTLC